MCFSTICIGALTLHRTVNSKAPEFTTKASTQTLWFSQRYNQAVRFVEYCRLECLEDCAVETMHTHKYRAGDCLEYCDFEYCCDGEVCNTVMWGCRWHCICQTGLRILWFRTLLLKARTIEIVCFGSHCRDRRSTRFNSDTAARKVQERKRLRFEVHGTNEFCTTFRTPGILGRTMEESVEDDAESQIGVFSTAVISSTERFCCR